MKTSHVNNSQNIIETNNALTEKYIFKIVYNHCKIIVKYAIVK